MDSSNNSLLKSKLFRYGCYLLLALIIIYMFGKIKFFISPFQSFVYSIIFPILFGGLLYYILRPIVLTLEKGKIPHIWAIVLAFVIVLSALILLSSYTGSIIKSQFNDFAKSLPFLYEKAENTINNLLSSNLLSYFNDSNFQSLDIADKVSNFLQSAAKSIGKNTINLIGAITNIGSVIIILPVILFYFLKDGHKFMPSVVRFFPASQKDNIRKILTDIDFVLSNYIAGQLLVAFFIGLLMYIGYLIIGLKYSLLLAIFAMITCIIPFFGPWIGIVPAILLSLADNPFMAVKIFLVMTIVQQIDNNFISPQVMKKSMDIHPLTVILLLMGIIPILGFIGLIIVIPLYSAIKITIKNIIEMYYPKYAETLNLDIPDEPEKPKKTPKFSFKKKK
ncbi:AI-2E family transporter [Ruminiclostridium josui]|uniref:AI-2E family transporter n=1 Tax=Ruminiclostridium josui TaxID=1499 RepID=UPI0004652E8A|nr:AI-2E family transporter [Ruminiclostridium josui]